MASELEMQEAEDCIDRLNDQIAALKAENERQKNALATLSKGYGAMQVRAVKAERALAERAGGVKGGDPLHLTEYEIQVLLGTSISGCNMSRNSVFSLDMAWHRLHAIGLIDRTDGLAIITKKGEEVVNRILSTLTTEPAAPEERQEAVALPPYGKMPFDELGRDVSEAGIGVRRDFDFGETYPGHVMTGINFNSLNRIVSKYATRPAEQAVTDEQRGAIAYALTKRLVIDMPTARAAVDEALAQKEEGR